MKAISKLFQNIRRNTDAATAVEYAMIIGLVALASFSVLSTLGGKVTNIITNMNTNLN